MASNEGRVYFALDGDNFEPDELTSFLGIEPTLVKQKEKLNPVESRILARGKFLLKILSTNILMFSK